jgi:hypothetical protein
MASIAKANDKLYTKVVEDVQDRSAVNHDVKQFKAYLR